VGELFFGKPPAPPRGDKLEKETNHPFITHSALVGYIPSSRWLPPKGECGDGKGEKMTSDE